MKPLSIRQVRQAVGGKALSVIPHDAPLVKSVCTDSRQMDPSALFVPIRGEKHDGSAFLPDAAAAGAVAALVESPPAVALPNLFLIQVPDTRKALGKLARYVRQTIRSKVIAVAGSNGKTSTKLLIDAALSSRLRGSVSPKSFNNDIGVPLTIFPADPMQDYLVLEVGTNHHGEIRVLSEMALPDVAVITNCGAEHLEGLGDLMGVRRENATLISGLKPGGLLIVNGDDRELLSAVKDYPGKRLTFGFEPHNDMFASDIVCTERGTEFSLNNSRRRVFVPMLGRHSACNALAAIAVGRKLGVPEEQIFSGLAEARGPDMRLQMTRVGSVRVLNDAYNANPNSMRAALETLTALPNPGRRIAVLGEMRELGQASERYHREIGALSAKGARLDLLICVGVGGEWIAESARQAGFDSSAVTCYSDSDLAADAVPGLLRDDDLVLVKASRGIRLERVADAIARTAEAMARVPARLAAS